jgi:putative transposase
MLEKYVSELREFARACKDYKERERLRALYALSIGKPFKLVSEIFCVNEDTLRNWVKKWEEEKSLKDAPRDGRPPSIDENDKKEIKKLVEENNPKKYGLNASAWDCSELKKYFARKNKIFSLEVIRKALKEMGAHYVKAVILFPEADEKKRLAFARTFIKTENSANAVVLFEDEMSMETSARKGYGWTFKERLVVKAPQSHYERMNLFGATSPYTGETIEMASSNAKADSYVKYLGKIARAHPRKLVWIYQDNTRVHKSKKAERFLEKHANIQLRYLPAYSPELNPREYWHGFLRKKLLNNTNYKNGLSLAKAVHAFARNTPKSMVKNVCTLNPIYALT